MAMRNISFSECRDYLNIPDGFSDDNLLITDGELHELPKLKFVRHGNVNKVVSGCRFEIPSSTKGNIAIFVSGDKSTIKIGQNTRLIVNFRMWRSPNIEIGDLVTINNARLVSDNSDITVGRDCMFSDEILIQSSDQHGLVDLETDEIFNSHRRRIEIGEHVWVGRGVTVMPDVKIGAGTVLGTGSIVTKDMPVCSIVVGVPAKTVRSRSSWTRLPQSIAPVEREFFDRMRRARYLEACDE